MDQNENKCTRIIGKTKASGFQIGVRRSFPVHAEQMWNFLFSPPALAVWLGIKKLPASEGTFVTEDKSTASVRMIKAGSHLAHELEEIKLAQYLPYSVKNHS